MVFLLTPSRLRWLAPRQRTALALAVVMLAATLVAGCGGAPDEAGTAANNGIASDGAATDRGDSLEPVTESTESPGNERDVASDSGDGLAPGADAGEPTEPDPDADTGTPESPPAAQQANLLNPAGQWQTWAGLPVAIQYDADARELQISPPGNGVDAVVGVQRYLQPLTAGELYRLYLPRATSGVSATLYLFDEDNNGLPYVNEVSGHLAASHRAVPGQSVDVLMPDGVGGFAVQLQGPWQASGQARASVFFAEVNAGDVATTVKRDYRPEGYDVLVLSDDFSGEALDRTAWCTRLAYGGGPPLQVPDDSCTRYPGMGVADYANIDENQRFRDFNNAGQALHVVRDGIIELRATLTGTDPYTRFEAAAIRSKKSFRPDRQTSYYLTARVQLPNVLGIWPAFFIIPGLAPNGEAQWPPEVDIFEGAINGDPGENAFTLIQHAQVRGAQTPSGESEWFYAAPGFDTSWGFWRSPVNLRDRWIEVGMEWTEQSVCYFIDGDKTACERYAWLTNDGRLANPAEVVMLLAVGGPWAGRGGIDDAAFPTSLKVDHIRVYERTRP